MRANQGTDLRRRVIRDDALLSPGGRSRRARLGASDKKGVAAAMDRMNPEALAAAIAGDLTPTHTLLDVLRRPFEAQPGRDAYAEPAPPDFGPYETHCNT